MHKNLFHCSIIVVKLDSQMRKTTRLSDINLIILCEAEDFVWSEFVVKLKWQEIHRSKHIYQTCHFKTRYDINTKSIYLMLSHLHFHPDFSSLVSTLPFSVLLLSRSFSILAGSAKLLIYIGPTAQLFLTSHWSLFNLLIPNDPTCFYFQDGDSFNSI